MTRAELTAAKSARDEKILSLAGRGVPQRVICERLNVHSSVVRRVISDARKAKA